MRWPDGEDVPSGEVAPMSSALVTTPPRMERRTVALVGTGVLLALTVVVSVTAGSRTIPLGTVWQVLWSPDGSTESAIVHDLRLPRTLLGLVAGAALGLAGALMQSLTRNPLAEPGLLGVNAGAAAAVVVGIHLGLSQPGQYVWPAVLGAGVASVAVYLIGSRGPSAGAVVRLALAGAAITAALMAFVHGMTFLSSATLDQYRFWAVGALSGRSLEVLVQVLPLVAVGGVLGLAMAGPLNALALGEDTSRALGARPGRVRMAVGLAVTLLCGAATAAVGPLMFVGLAVPHAVRALTGPDDRWVLPLSVLAAPSLLLASDVVGRFVVAPGELQAGVVMAFLGAPVLIALVSRRRLAPL